MGWNTLTSEPDLKTFDSRALSSGSYGATASWSNSSVINQVAMIALTGGGKVQQSTTNSHVDGAGFATWTITLPANNTAGNALVLDIWFDALTGTAGPVTVTDTHGNTWTEELISHPPFQGQFMATFVAFGIAAGANIVTITIGGSFPFTAIAAALHEYTGVTAVQSAVYGCGGLFGTGSPVSVSLMAVGAVLHLAVSPETLLTSVTGGGFTPCTPAWLMIYEGSPPAWADQSDKLHTTESIRFSWIVKQRGTATVPLVIEADDDYTPTIGSQVCLWDLTADGDFEVFSGTVDDLELKWTGIDGTRYFDLTCVSLEQVFDTIRLPSLLFVDQTAGSIFTALFAYASGSPVTLGTIEAGATIANFLISDYPTISEAFSRLATLSEYVWGVDPGTGSVYFTPPNITAAPFTLESEDVLWEQFTLKEERHDYRNRQIIKANSNAAVKSSEYFVGAGQSSFTLLRPCAQITTGWLTQNTQNHATGTFTGQPAPGDTITFSYAAGGGGGFTWVANNTYFVGAVIIDPNGNAQRATIAGGGTQSGAVQPTWKTNYGDVTTDNTMSWTNEGPPGFGPDNTYTYTFVTSLATGSGATSGNAQFGYVLIGPTLTATILNLWHAINSIQDFAGITFSLPTWENPIVNADTPTSTTLIVRNKTAGAAFVAGLTKSCANFSWSNGVTSGGVTTFGTSVITTGVQGQTTGGSVFTVVYTPGSAIISSATALQPGNNLQIEYLASNVGYVAVEDTAAVNARAIIEGGTGKYQQTSSDDQALTLPQALQLAQQQLAAFGVIPQTFEFTTFRAGLYVGQVLNIEMLSPANMDDYVNTTLSPLSRQWFIQEINAESIPVYADEGDPQPYLPNGGHYRYAVRCIDATQIGSWIDFWEGLTGGGGSASGVAFPGGGSLGSSNGGSSYAASFTSSASVTVTHGLNTTAVMVQVYDTSGNQVIPSNVQATDANTVVLTFGVAMAGSVVVIGA